MACDVNAEHIGPCGPDCILHDLFAAEKESSMPLDTVPAAQQHFLIAVRHSGMPIERQWQWVMEWAEEWQTKVDLLAKMLRAAEAALRSYQHGNASTDLAQEVADGISATLIRLTPKPD
jgi:hypothetical protein